ncbi:MAG: hypothetical protein DSY38_03400 [Fusobacteria bacterium]|nr:MAG: hypothetical protein DSY38_03400 [Fusobacteriota bacterium]
MVLLLYLFLNIVVLAEDLIYPTSEGHQIEEQDTSILERIEDTLRLPKGFTNRFVMDTGEEATINVGPSATIIPYYAKLKYLLDPTGIYSPYYLIMVGANYVEDDDIAISKMVEDISQMLNYGIGVGVEFPNTEIEILYGRYNYQMIWNGREEDKNLYSSTKLTISYKYKF